MLTFLKLSDGYLEIDLNVETVFRIRLDGRIKNTSDDTKVEYIGSGLRITVDKTNTRFEIHTGKTILNVSYVDFPDMPEVLAEIVDSYNEYLDDMNSECDYCHGAVGYCGGRCRDRD
jgi:flagellar capping protein FliD